MHTCKAPVARRAVTDNLRLPEIVVDSKYLYILMCIRVNPSVARRPASGSVPHVTLSHVGNLFLLLLLLLLSYPILSSNLYTISQSVNRSNHSFPRNKMCLLRTSKPFLLPQPILQHIMCRFIELAFTLPRRRGGGAGLAYRVAPRFGWDGGIGDRGRVLAVRGVEFGGAEDVELVC